MNETARGIFEGACSVPPLPEQERMVEAVLFASREPLTGRELAERLPRGADIGEALAGLRRRYEGRGVQLVRVGDAWAFRTAADLGFLMSREVVETRKLSRAAIETLAIVAYHQPATRAEIEEIRGVAASAGTLDVLMEVGWVRPRGRRRAPGRPITYGTTEEFLIHFGLESIKDLPGLAELKGAGLLENNLPPDFTVPEPTDASSLMADELPLEAGDEEGPPTLFSGDPHDDEGTGAA
jgi:segregation and condensation protein B